jgi:3-phosphoshikimate 1-carboxyvinyltransferase
MKLCLRSAPRLRGEIAVPGDKSITHRALLLGAISQGASRIEGSLSGGDCQATVGCLQALGVTLERPGPNELIVRGQGLRGWREPANALNCVRSGTTMRLLAGLLAGQAFYSVLGGDAQLLRRPMDRVAEPLRQMGAQIWGREGGRLPPLSVQGSPLRGAPHRLAVASAQVKSCLLLAGLYAQGETTVLEPGPSRDHTERMLRARGVAVETEGLRHTLQGPVEALQPVDTVVPGDFSSAAYFIVGALLAPNSRVLIRNVGVNPTRTGLLDALAAMGAAVQLLDPHETGGEPVADLLIESQSLRAAEVRGDLAPRMIDEFPILALAATQAQGLTHVRDAAELRVKESDRIATIVSALRALGARIEPTADGFDIEGPTPLQGATVESYGDHRLAMTLAIASLIAAGQTTIQGAECIADSFPGFQERLMTLTEGAVL